MAKKTAKPAPNDRLGARKAIELPVATPEQARLLNEQRAALKRSQ